MTLRNILVGWNLHQHHCKNFQVSQIKGVLGRFTQTWQVSGFCSTIQEEAGAQNPCLVQQGAM